jgi:hypothetical protein
MCSLILALVLACVAGLLFAATRWLGILAVAVLCFLFPLVVTATVVVAGAACLYLFLKLSAPIQY